MLTKDFCDYEGAETPVLFREHLQGIEDAFDGFQGLTQLFDEHMKRGESIPEQTRELAAAGVSLSTRKIVKTNRRIGREKLTMPHPRFTNEEIARRGEDIYASRLQASLEKDHLGQVVINDIESGEYEIGHDSLAANRRALAKHPGAALYGIRVGFPFVESISGPRLTKQ